MSKELNSDTPSLIGYINKLIKQGTTFIQNTNNTYRLVYFKELNKVYVYYMPNSEYNRKYQGKWRLLGPYKINSRKKMRGVKNYNELI